MRDMNIGFFTENFYPELSGITDSISTTARELGKRGHTVHIFAPSYAPAAYERVGHMPGKEIDLGQNVAVHRLAAMSFPAGTGQARAVFPTLLRWIRWKGLQLDVIHSHHNFGVGVEALTAARALRIPFVGTHHTVTEAFAEYAGFAAPLFRKTIPRFSAWYFRQARFLSAPSQVVLDDLATFGRLPESRVISNPIDTDVFHPVNQVEKQRAKDQLKLNAFVVLYSGRLSPEKKLDISLRAFAEFAKERSGAFFVLTGHGSERASLEKLAADLGIADRVRFTGTIPQDELVRYYHASDVFLVTSVSETQCMAMMKGLASGLPAIGVRSWGLPEYITPDVGYIAKVDAVSEVAEYLKTLGRDAVLREQLGAAARKRAESWNSQAIADVWEGVYTQIVGK